MLMFSKLTFITSFRKSHLSVKAVWVHIRLDVLSGLIGVQSVYKLVTNVVGKTQDRLGEDNTEEVCGTTKSQ